MGTSQLLAQEDCFNGVDDDSDGLIDLNDTTDCICLNALSGGGSVIPNPSFEEHTCLPTTWSMLNCATGWEPATQPAPDYFNTASYYPAIFPQPVPDGNGLAGGYMFPGWREYIGTCLNGPIPAGQPSTLNLKIAATAPDGTFSSVEPIFFGPVNVTVFGRSDCVTFPVNVTDCPQPMGWTALGSATYNPSTTWSTLNIPFVPAFDVATIMLGAPCDLPPEYVLDQNYYPYFLYDDLHLGGGSVHYATIDNFVDTLIDPIDDSCQVVHVLYAHPDTLTSIYQWFHDGVALVGQTDTILDLAANDLEPGLYQFYFQVDDTTCVVTEIDAQVPDHPAPAFSMTDPDGCAPIQILFTNTTPPGPPMTCQWTLEGIGVTAACNPLITYPDPGSYDVTLTVTYPDACPLDTTVINAVNVFEVQTPEIIANSGQLCASPLGNSTQWYLDGVPFATTDCIPANDPGSYTVFVDYGSPCQTISAPYLALGIGGVTVPPWSLTCTADQLMVQFQRTLIENGRWTLLDATGRRVAGGKVPTQGALHVDLSNEANGIYLFQVGQNGNVLGKAARFALAH